MPGTYTKGEDKRNKKVEEIAKSIEKSTVKKTNRKSGDRVF